MLKSTLLSLFILFSLSINAQTRRTQTYNNSSLLRAGSPSFDYNAMSRQKDRELQMMIEQNNREQEYLNQLYNQQAQQLKRTVDGMGKPSCQEALNAVKGRGNYEKVVIKSEMSSTDDWLKKVKLYSLEGRLFVVAEMFTDDYHINSKEYLYCDIPAQNWNAFYTGSAGRRTYGERFHDFIIDYKCNCQ
ncbi:hypothetical protein [Dyadobacter sp. CY312]|uniref:hypothetical protein n=1 Tax=Dyadobacter sp. CY312 TaxID=2907303 RepID=UPI001F205222|nr:hypothetical protein [Dyadobacter sp. CY312]MCE7039186.1 hypothetical protein [Dyadobacter sp. CY312]